MPALKTQLQFEMEFSPAEYEKLALGLLPRDMETDGSSFWKTTGHRSWTGSCIYLCRIELVAANYRVAETWINRDQVQ